MRRTMTWTLAVGLALAAAGTVLAQGRGGFGMFGGAGGVTLLTNASVQAELKVTDEQKGKLRDFAQQQQAKMRERMQSMFQGGGDPQEMMGKIQEEMAKFNAESLKEVAPLLKPEQLKRFKEIDLQQSGFQAFTINEDVQKSLKMTDEQRAKYKKLASELQQDTMELFQGGGFGNPETLQKMVALTKQYNDKAKEMLTADQRKTYLEMLGKPFELQAGQRGG